MASVAGNTGDDEVLADSDAEVRRVPPLVVNGLEESEILDFAPPMVCDRVHWDTVDSFDARELIPVLSALDPPMDAYTRQWSDGQHRIWVPAGQGHDARVVIREWCEQNDVEAVNVRVVQGVPFRNLDLIPGTLLPDLIAAAVDWLYPRLAAVRRKLVADLELVDDEDVRSMMYLFVFDHMDRFDADREGKNGTLTLLAFLIGKLRNWPQDAARQAQGRPVVADRLAIAKAREGFAAEHQRAPSESELADALGMSVTDLRRRQQTIDTLSGLRNYQSLDAGSRDDEGGTFEVADEADVESEATERTRNAQLTRAIMAAVNDPESTGKRAQDPLALAAVYLSFWEGLSRPDVARELEVLPKTASAAVKRVLDSVAEAGLT